MFDQILNAFGIGQNLPQTQEDIRVLAQAAQQAQSPQFQAQLLAAQSKVEQYANAQLAMQAVSTVALVGILIVLMRKR